MTFKPEYRILQSNYNRKLMKLRGTCSHPSSTGWINLGDGTDRSKNVKICRRCGKILDRWTRVEILDPIIISSLFERDTYEMS